MNMERKGIVTEKNILGSYSEGKNLYLINWSRVANFGYNMMWAKDEQDVIDNFLFADNPYVDIIVTKIDKDNLPVIFKRTKK